jgi:CBS domain-containing protein
VDGRTKFEGVMAMRVRSAVLGFGAGLAIGASRETEMFRQLRQRVRGAIHRRVSSVLAGPERSGVREVWEAMTPLPTSITSTRSLAEAARMMAERDIGDVLVTEPGSDRILGILTDRDIAIRAVAEGSDPRSTSVGDVMSRDLTTILPRDTVDHAMRRMKAAHVRRLPVMEDGQPIGVISMGDVSRELDAGDALADISTAPPNR